MNYIARRVLRAILLLIGVSALCFLFTEMAPGSFFDEMRLNPQISPRPLPLYAPTTDWTSPSRSATAAG